MPETSLTLPIVPPEFEGTLLVQSPDSRDYLIVADWMRDAGRDKDAHFWEWASWENLRPFPAGNPWMSQKVGGRKWRSALPISLFERLGTQTCDDDPVIHLREGWQLLRNAWEGWDEHGRG